MKNMNIWTDDVTRKYGIHCNDYPNRPWTLQELRDFEKKIGLPNETIRVVLGEENRKFDLSLIQAHLDERDILTVKHDNHLYYLMHTKETSNENSRITDMWLSECSKSTLREKLENLIP